MGTDTQFDFVENGSVTSPLGFLACGVIAGLKKNKAPDLAMIESETECSFAATFTSNLFPAAPVQYDREICANSPKIRAVVANSGVANACTGLDGYNNAKRMAELTAGALSVPVGQVMIASTGRIGVQLPMDLIENGIREAAKSLTHNGGSSAAHAIMTTDTEPKEVAVQIEIGGKTVTIGSMCKGSGMIHPNMATMLVFITTDAAISSEMLQKAVSTDVQNTFNMISVDGDTSTNDMVTVLANGLAGNAEITAEGEDFTAFMQALNTVTVYLCRCIAGDGEGATKLLECKVSGAETLDIAKTVAKSVICSSLTKAAMFGADANWGRVLCAIGYSGADVDVNKIDVSFKSKSGEILVCQNGAGVDFSEEKAKEILLNDEIEILIDLKSGSDFAVARGCDLTYDYVKINGDYRA